MQWQRTHSNARDIQRVKATAFWEHLAGPLYGQSEASMHWQWVS